ncbi:MAG: galactokinase [Mycetocola sp.]
MSHSSSGQGQQRSAATGEDRAGLAHDFATLYGVEPTGLWAAPGRVNLIGEHTDYNDGLVMPFAINARAVAGVAERSDGLLALASRQQSADEPRVVSVDGLSPSSLSGWGRYPAGVVWAFQQRGVDVPGFSILLDSLVPVGSGLSSSAAIECAVAIAINDLTGAGLSREELVLLCQSAENDFVGAPTGILDQSASLLSSAGHALFLDCRTRHGEAVALDLDAAGLELIVIDTRVSHAHESGGYRDRVESCRLGARLLGVSSLRDVTAADLPRAESVLDDTTFRRVRHIVTENVRVEQVVAALAQDGPRAIGGILTASHASMRDDYSISCPELDLVVDAALTAGALGARMTGGGFGGSAIALVDSSESERVRDAVSAAFADAGYAPCEQFVVVPGPGAVRVL